MSVCASLCQIASPSGSSMDDSSIYDSGTVSSMDSLLGPERMHPDFRIRQRLEASRQGMLQLDLLRTKHQKLMQDMRHRLSQFDDGSEVRSRPKRTVHGTIPLNTITPSEVKLDDQRCDSPISCCVSHRSSISMDSGCISVSSDPSSHSSMSYSTYRKLSVEERCKQLEESPTNDGHHRIVATAIESTTALRCPETKRYPRNCQRPKSMCCAAFPDESNTLLVDSRSFSQITPPPIHRNFTAVTRCESLQTRTTPYSPRNCFNARLAVVKDLPMSPVRVAVGQSPMLQTKPILYISQAPSSPPHTRIRNPQKAEPQQSVFHASRVFVERSPRDICQRVESMEKVDSDEDSTHVAQPAIVVSRQQSYAQSSESSQFESREVYVVDSSDPNSFIPSQHHQLKRCESSETTMAERTRRRVTPEKEWKESEGL